MGRLTLNVLLSFAQFEREVTGERIRDKIAASKRKGLWMGGSIPVGYTPHERTLVIDAPQANNVKEIFRLYLQTGCVRRLKQQLDQLGYMTPIRVSNNQNTTGGRSFSKGNLYRILTNPLYIGQIRHKETKYPGQHPAIIDVVTWQAVQEQLSLNRQGQKTKLTSINPSLLAGLLWDVAGVKLTPTHAKKGSRRYRYYTTGANAEAKQTSTQRWPAQPLEELVVNHLKQFLNDESRLIDYLTSMEAEQIKQYLKTAEVYATELESSTIHKKIDLLQKLIGRITVSTSDITMTIKVAAMCAEQTENQQQNKQQQEQQLAIIHIPIALKRCGMAVRLIVQSSGSDNKRKPDPKLIAKMAKAYEWFERIASGKADSIQSIAKEEQVGSSYVTRVMHLASLAPDIVKRIARGDHPPELTIDRLIRMVPFPNNWDEQRKLLRVPIS